MDKNLLEKYLKLLASENDADAVMSLRGAQNLFKSEGTSLENALLYAANHIGQLQKVSAKTVDHQPAETVKAASAPATVNTSGVPEFRVPHAGALEIVPAGQDHGQIYPLTGAAAKQAEVIAAHLKDAIVVAVISKSRFKLKLIDIKNSGGEVIETVLQAEYDRPGTMPIQIWSHGRGEIGSLAAVLRKAIATSLPDLAA